MPIHTILVPFCGSEKESNTLEYAFRLAKQNNALVKGIHVSPDPNNYVYPGMGIAAPSFDDFIHDMSQNTLKHMEQAKELFEKTAKRLKIPMDTSSNNGKKATAQLLQKTGDMSETIANRGRVSDLIIMNRHITISSPDYASAVITALFETGRPTILTPSTPLESHHNHIAIAWNGSSQAAKAVHSSLDFLIKAKKVSIITIGNIEQGPSANELVYYLSTHGIKAKSTIISESSTPNGKALLEAITDSKANLFISGAFTHNRLRQMIIGGVTSYLLENAEIPVLMVH